MTGEILDQEYKASEAFGRQAAQFDQIYENNPITLLMRQRVRAEVLRNLAAGNNMLELNCGTGIDTVFFARKGAHVLATDNSECMLRKLSDKVREFDLQQEVSVKKCSFNDLSSLGGTMFDYVFSNFGGLNCTADLPAVLTQMDSVLKPGGYFTFVIMPVVCPWEVLSLLRGRTKVAFRRFRKAANNAHIEGVYFNCFYHNPSVIRKTLKYGYQLVSLRGLGSLMPPPFMDYFPSKYPKTFAVLRKADDAFAALWPFHTCCDQYVITMRKNCE